MNNKYVNFIHFVYSNNCAVLESDFEKKVVRLEVYSTIKDRLVNEFKQIAHDDFGFTVKIRKKHVAKQVLRTVESDCRSAAFYESIKTKKSANMFHN